MLLGELDRPPCRVRGPGRLRGRSLHGFRLVGSDELGLALGDEGDAAAQLDLFTLRVEMLEDPVARGLELEQRFRRLDLADGLACLDALAVVDEPFDEESPLGVRVLSGENELEQPSAPDDPERAHGAHDVVHSRQHCLLERRRGGNDPVAGGDPLHRPT